LLGGGAGPGERSEEAGEDFRLEVRPLAVVPTAKLGDQGAQSGQREPDRGQPPGRSCCARVTTAAQTRFFTSSWVFGWASSSRSATTETLGCCPVRPSSAGSMVNRRGGWHI
jgi:hypothetical protein